MRQLGRTLLGIAVLRALSGAFIVAAYDPDSKQAVAICFGVYFFAVLSDHFDGWIARNFSRPSLLGYLQDSISDKLLHIGCMLALSRRFEWLGLALWCVVAREMILLAARIVSSNVDQSLRQYRIHSLIYAAFVRIGITGFFVASLLESLLNSILIAVSYAVVSIGILYGLFAAVFISITSQSREEPR